MAYWTTVGSYTATTMIERKSSQKRRDCRTLRLTATAKTRSVSALKDNKIVVWRRERKNHRVLSTTDAPTGKTDLSAMNGAGRGILQFCGQHATARNFKTVGQEQNGDYLPPWDRGVRVALTVGGAENAAARFGFLRIEPTK